MYVCVCVDLCARATGNVSYENNREDFSVTDVTDVNTTPLCVLCFFCSVGGWGGVVGLMAGAGTRNLAVGRMQTGAPSRRPGSEDGRGGKPSVQAASTDPSCGLCCGFPHIIRI